MDRVDAMKKLQGWTDTSVLHFRNLGMFGEQILLSIRYGAWSAVYEPTAGVQLGALLASADPGIYACVSRCDRRRPVVEVRRFEDGFDDALGAAATAPRFAAARGLNGGAQTDRPR